MDLNRRKRLGQHLEAPPYKVGKMHLSLIGMLSLFVSGYSELNTIITILINGAQIRCALPQPIFWDLVHIVGQIGWDMDGVFGAPFDVDRDDKYRCSTKG